MMKRLLTYGLLLLTILASHFVVSACQDDLPETTEVMMTFTTRAVVTQGNESEVINVEKMKNLRVIMVREDGTIAYKEVNEINGSSVTVTFNTPVKTGGENFQFFAIANEDGILPAQNLGSIQSGDIEDLKNRVVGSGSEFTISNAIPQTKYWTAKVNPYESLSVSQQLDYLVSKISVQFKNETNKAQSLSNIHITGITPNGMGRLFNRPTGEKDNEGEEIYEEVYVTENSDVTLNNGITFNGVADLPSGESSAIQHYYTYPVDNGNISSPTLYAKWGDEVEPRKLELTGFTELKRNDHLKILITLTDVGIKVTYTIADWEENTTTIGGVNPTLGDSYMVKDWVQGDDVVIGEEPVEPEPEPEPDPGTGGEVPGEGTTLWNSDAGQQLSYSPYGFVTNQQLLNSLTAGQKIYIEMVCNHNTASENKLAVLVNADWAEMPSLAALQEQYQTFSKETTTYYFTLSDADITELKKDNQGIYMVGAEITITRIYVK